MKKAFYIYIFSFVIQVNVFTQQNFWIPLNGPYDGDVYSIIADSSGLVLAGTGNGIFRSTDFGNSWDLVSSLSMEWGGFTFGDNDTIYGVSIGGNGFLRSTNKGMEWETIGNLGGYCTVNDDGGIIYSGGINNQGTGIFKSTDGGVTWVKKFSNGWNAVRSMIMTPDKRIFAGCNELGVVRSINGGETWDTVNVGLDGNYFMSISLVYPNILFCASDFGLYKSTNWGDSWSIIYSGYEVQNVAAISEQILFIRTNGYGVWKTTNGGLNWIGPFLAGNNPLALFILKDQYVFCSSYQFGLFRSSDSGNNWAQVGIPGTHITSIIELTNGTLFAGAAQNWYPYEGQLYQSTNEGISWSNIRGRIPWTPTDNNMNLSSASNDIIFLSNGEFGVFRSTDLGQTWTRNNNGISQFDWVYSTIVTNNGNILAATNTGCYISTDNGLSWNHSSMTNYFEDFYINPNGIIYTCSSPIRKSTDNAVIWETLGTTGLTADVTSLSTNSSGNIFAGTEDNVPPPYTARGGIFLSTDNGMTWEHKSVGLPHNGDNYVDINKIIITPADKIYAATNVGIYYSTNNGESWSSMNSGLIVNDIYTLFIDSQGFLLAGSAGNGIYKSINSVLDSSEDENNTPNKFFLYQNYPNPFNPSTKIKYSIPHSSFVTLKVYDLLGKEVAILVNEEKPVGYYEIEFNGNNLSSGIYFYSMETGNFSDTKKLILIK